MKLIAIIVFFFSASYLQSQYMTISTHFGYGLTQQQVKTEIGGDNYPKLFNHNQFNFNLQTQYNFNDYIAVGAYLRYDRGNRTFSGVLRENELFVINSKDNDFTELWLGPILTGSYKSVFLSFGYALSANRDDDFVDIENENEVRSPLNASSFAWFTHLGGKFELSSEFQMVVMLEYRVRYYDQIDGSNINFDNKIGMQNITPMIGFEYNFDI
ncbi:MAG: hypothetical protein ACE364_07785 [Chlorobiota bacterium]